MSRIALISGSPGARQEAIAAELTSRGWAVRQLLYPGGELPDLGAAADGAEALIHVGVRTPRDRDAAWRAEAEARAAGAAGLAARDRGCRRFVLVSTASVYGRPRELPCGEGAPKAPRTAVERARWGAERAAWRALRAGAPLVVLRPTAIYGPSLRGGVVRALSLIALLAQRLRRVPILRRGPVAHLVHIEDVAGAVAHVAEHGDDRGVIGRAFNVADEAPLPFAEHLEAALDAMGCRAGRVLPWSPRLAAALLWLVRSLPDRVLFEPVNRLLQRAWRELAPGSGAALLAPRIDREALHWMAADHYYDTRRLAALGWRPRHPVAADAFPGTVRALLEAGVLPTRAARA